MWISIPHRLTQAGVRNGELRLGANEIKSRYGEKTVMVAGKYTGVRQRKGRDATDDGYMFGYGQALLKGWFHIVCIWEPLGDQG